MIQPELGKHIAQLRSSQGLTQQALADTCKLNIRTIQRIEAGEVVPRMYTLNLLTTPLNMDMNQLSFNSPESNALSLKMKSAFYAGAVFFINGLAVVYDLITHSFNPTVHTITTLIHVVSWAFFFAGFYYIGKFYKNKLLYISSLIMMVVGPLLNILELLKPYAFSIGTFLIFIIMCIDMLMVGVGFLKEAFERKGYETAIYIK